MIKALLLAVPLLFARGAAAITCNINEAFKVPNELEPAVTSFCRDIFETIPATAKAVPAPLSAFLPAGGGLSSFCSCVLNHPVTRTTAAPNTSHSQLSCTSSNSTRTVSITQFLCSAAAKRETITVTRTASMATITVTASMRQTLCTATAQTTSITGQGTGSILTDIVTVSETASTATVTITASGPAPTVTLSVSTVTLAASTVTVTTTANPNNSTSSSTSTSLSSTAPLGPPTCTQAANPSGACGYPANYNSGTTPQLWGGAAGSLDACALLCAGEPGCLSLAYSPGGTLQCVLFNTKTSALTTTSEDGSSMIFYDSTCFACSGAAPRPLTDNNCTPALQPPANSLCDFNAILAGPLPFVISPSGDTALSVGACAQQCLLLSACVSFSFDGTNCQLYSSDVIQLELSGFVFPVDPGVAGSTILYDRGCLVCPTPGCTCPLPVSKRELARREAGLERREADLKRRVLAVADRERMLVEYW